ncbi:TonB-dependent receptor plug domain-containing protein [Chitinophaga arvensicola]|uniref:Iron complex outermembrane recepter protein n=1 Tax=Chitinophaga arvensicola TaxID=29529 RepID=A0A1I0S501_9BACT|nr:TonB-dependent receptor [Chitinophaga arvensicola]SEW49872.1 iron complex outermembrane recepter protein [Chitinophaga arvensicola]
MRVAIPNTKILVSLLLGLSGSVAAQQRSDTALATRHLDEVIVQENRLSAPVKAVNRNITIITRRQIEALPVTSITEVLSYVPGLDVRQRGPGGIQADIGIDGGTFDQTLVLINGVKVTDPQTGHNVMNLPVSLQDVDHIEVLRGAAARIYGINALNGAINIVTRKATESGASIKGSGGSSFKKNENGNLYAGYNIGGTGSLVSKYVNQSLSVERNQGNGYRYNTAYDNYRAFYQAAFNQDTAHQYNVMAGFVNNNYGANGFYAAPGDLNSEETVKTFLAAVSNTSRINPHWVMTPRISYRYTKDDYIYIKPDKFRNLHNTHVLDAELNNTFTTAIGTFGAGVEGRYEKIKSSNLGNHDRTNLGAFGEYKSPADRRFNFSVGGYLNYNTVYGWQFFPGADVGFNITPDIKLFANAGTAQRLPTYTDLYYKGGGIIGNENLGPEKASYAEAGIRKFSGRFSFSASAFYRQVSNFIDFVKDTAGGVDPTKVPWQPQNFQRADMTGFSLNTGYTTTLHPDAFFNSFGVNAGYNYLSPSFKGDALSTKISRYVIESLRHQFTANVRTDLLQHFSVSAAARYCMRINYKDYTLVDARIAFRQPRYQIYADASNLLDVTYVEAGASLMPGRWITLGGKVNF